MSSLPHKPVLDPSSTTILVTGASGFIASHVVNEALKLGYSVRGTARTEAKAANTKKIFNNNPRYTTAIVSDFGKETPEIDEAVKGVDAVVHVASDTTFSDDPEVVVKGVVRGTEAFLKAAAKEKRVKRFVLTSSTAAAFMPQPNKEFSVSVDSWADDAIDVAWNKKGESLVGNPYPFVVYSASKAEGEKAMWKFAKEEKPQFVVNSVLPNFNSGRVLKDGSPGVTASMVLGFFKSGEKPDLPPQYFIDVVDDARIHLIAAVLDESVSGQRIFAAAEPFNWTRAIDAIKKARPDAKVEFKKEENEPRDLSKLPNELGAKLLKKWFGQDGYKSWDQSIKENLEDV